MFGGKKVWTSVTRMYRSTYFPPACRPERAYGCGFLQGLAASLALAFWASRPQRLANPSGMWAEDLGISEREVEERARDIIKRKGLRVRPDEPRRPPAPVHFARLEDVTLDAVHALSLVPEDTSDRGGVALVGEWDGVNLRQAAVQPCALYHIYLPKFGVFDNGVRRRDLRDTDLLPVDPTALY